MIIGEYQERKSQVTVELTLFGPRGDSVALTATIDTGFTGFLMIPERTAQELSLQALRDLEIVLADGSSTWLHQYDAEIDWDGRRRNVPVYASQGDPLIGMKLLRRHLVTLELVPEGSITIERAA